MITILSDHVSGSTEERGSVRWGLVSGQLSNFTGGKNNLVN